MKIGILKITACEMKTSSKTNKPYCYLHAIDQSTGFVYHAFSSEPIEKGSEKRVALDYPKFGNFDIVPEEI